MNALLLLAVSSLTHEHRVVKMLNVDASHPLTTTMHGKYTRHFFLHEINLVISMDQPVPVYLLLSFISEFTAFLILE